MPAGGASDPSALIAARWTSRVSGTVVVTEGPVTAVPVVASVAAAWASTGWVVSTPE